MVFLIRSNKAQPPPIISPHDTIIITVKPEILAGIKFGSLAQNHYCKNISGFKFGGLVQDRHMHICE